MVEDPATLIAPRDTTNPRQGNAAQRRFRIYKVPGGASRLDTLGKMLSMVRGGMPVDEYLRGFKHAFPSITRRDMAERFMRVMIAFGLAVITDDRVMLTAEGSAYLNADATEQRRVLAKLFTERIYGAAELLAADVGYPSNALLLQQALATDGAASLTATQARYLIAWAGELGLLKQRQPQRPT